VCPECLRLWAHLCGELSVPELLRATAPFQPLSEPKLTGMKRISFPLIALALAVGLFMIAAGDVGTPERARETASAPPAARMAVTPGNALDEIPRAEGAQGLATAAFQTADGRTVLLDRSGPVATLLFADTGEALVLDQLYGNGTDLLLANPENGSVVVRLTGRGNAILYDDDQALGRPLEPVERPLRLSVDEHVDEDRG